MTLHYREMEISTEIQFHVQCRNELDEAFALPLLSAFSLHMTIQSRFHRLCTRNMNVFGLALVQNPGTP